MCVTIANGGLVGLFVVKGLPESESHRFERLANYVPIGYIFVERRCPRSYERHVTKCQQIAGPPAQLR